MITTIFLDIDNTLLDFHACSKKAIVDIFEEMKVPYNKNYYHTFSRINNNLWNNIQNGVLTKSELYMIRWPSIFKELNLDIDGIIFEKKFLHHLESFPVAVNGAYELLEFLSKKFTLCVTSNAPYKQQIGRLKNANMYNYFKHIFISENIGYEKPSINFFNECLLQANCANPNQVLMIGDSLSADILGANNANINSCWYNHEALTNNSGIFPDYTVNRLVDIIKLDILNH